jgi:hypothetical protein
MSTRCLQWNHYNRSCLSECCVERCDLLASAETDRETLTHTRTHSRTRLPSIVSSISTLLFQRQTNDVHRTALFCSTRATCTCCAHGLACRMCSLMRLVRSFVPDVVRRRPSTLARHVRRRRHWTSAARTHRLPVGSRRHTTSNSSIRDKLTND